MRKFFIIAIILLALGAVAGGLDAVRTSGNGSESKNGTFQRISYVTITIPSGDTELVLEIADTPRKRSLGLGGREGLPENGGMLFIFDESRLHGFWMKDMRFSIDIAWLNDGFCIVYLSRGVSPDTYPTVYVPETPARYVIEMKSGFFASHGLFRGDCLEKPAL